MVPSELVILLSEIPGLGPRKIRALLTAFPNARNLEDVLDAELGNVDGISREIVRRMRETPSDLGRRIADRLDSLDIRFLHYWMDEYPVLLKAIYDAPVGLYIRGTGSFEGGWLAVVGTRNPTDYGSKQVRKLCRDLCGAGLGIVSGFARGIDTLAHATALDAGSPTTAVLGCGVDIIYPAENSTLFQRMLNHGLIISEYPPGTKPDGRNFPKRNRIISGLSLGTLVIEAGHDSGALITAFNANDQGREVFAVPGRIDNPKTSGAHRLIQQGAKLIQNAADVLEEIAPGARIQRGSQLPLVPDLTQIEQRIFEYLSHESTLVDEIAEDLSMDVSEVLGVLLALELKGVVIQYPGKRFSRA